MNLFLKENVQRELNNSFLRKIIVQFTNDCIADYIVTVKQPHIHKVLRIKLCSIAFRPSEGNASNSRPLATPDKDSYLQVPS